MTTNTTRDMRLKVMFDSEEHEGGIFHDKYDYWIFRPMGAPSREAIETWLWNVITDEQRTHITEEHPMLMEWECEECGTISGDYATWIESNPDWIKLMDHRGKALVAIGNIIEDGELVFCGSDETGTVHLNGYDVGEERIRWVTPKKTREATPAEVAAIWGDQVPTASDFDETEKK